MLSSYLSGVCARTHAAGRFSLPFARHHVSDCISATQAKPDMSEQASQVFKFGPWDIQPSEVFYTSNLSFGFVNLKPLVPGHVLVSPKRVVNRFSELTKEEVADLWVAAHTIGSCIEPHYKAGSLTFAIQDGPAAGQTVPHVHIHILPRQAGDFEPKDKVYDALEEQEQGMNKLHEKVNLDVERKARTAEEMSAEASELRRLF